VKRYTHHSSRAFVAVAIAALTSLTAAVRPAGAGSDPRASGGWFLGFGGGGAHASATSGNTTTTSTESGFGFTLGAAYDFRIRSTFPIGPQVDSSWMTLSDFDANDVNFGLSFDSHFIGQ